MSEPDSNGSSFFSFMAVLSALIGIAWFVAGLFGLVPPGVQGALFGPAMLVAGASGALEFLVLRRMANAGYEVGFWRTLKDFKLHSEYWRIAPEKKWSRAPLVGFWCGFVAAAGLFLASVRWR
jgi:hypothetical protein